MFPRYWPARDTGLTGFWHYSAASKEGQKRGSLSSHVTGADRAARIRLSPCLLPQRSKASSEAAAVPISASLAAKRDFAFVPKLECHIRRNMRTVSSICCSLQTTSPALINANSAPAQNIR